MRRSMVARAMRIRADELALAGMGEDDGSVGCNDSAKSGKSNKSKKSTGGCHKEKVGILEQMHLHALAGHRMLSSKGQ